MNKIFYKKKISLLKKNIIKQKTKIIKFCKKDKINMLGAGGVQLCSWQIIILLKTESAIFMI